jgi:serine protease Do
VKCARLLALLTAVVLATPRGFSQTAPPRLRELSASFEALAARVRPAVVQIFATGYARTEENADGADTGLLTRQTATGSGVILGADGYIVTNNHVVQSARKIEVKLAMAMRDPQHSQEMTLPAKLVGADRESDLAVIKIDRGNLPTLDLGDSDKLQQGELVMAFGNPLGLEGSASMGIVSSTSRRVKQDDPRAYIQTDAPINPGNSGGPLVDTEGRVVGINTFILTQSGGSEGIGFAVPSNNVRLAYDQIRKDGHVHRGHIGLSVQTVTPTLAKGLGLAQDWGAVVSDLESGGPAETAGLKVGDVVKSANGKDMEDAGHLEEAIYRLGLNQSVDLAVIREGTTMNIKVAVHESEDDPERFADMVDPNKNLVPQLGILAIELSQKLTDMLPELRHEYGIVVAARSANAPYSGASLELGDVIYEINHSPTLTVKFLRDRLNAMKPGDSVVLQVEREGKLLYIPLELE